MSQRNKTEVYKYKYQLDMYKIAVNPSLDGARYQTRTGAKCLEGT